jgi:hypothetical protein
LEYILFSLAVRFLTVYFFSWGLSPFSRSILFLDACPVSWSLSSFLGSIPQSGEVQLSYLSVAAVSNSVVREGQEVPFAKYFNQSRLFELEISHKVLPVERLGFGRRERREVILGSGVSRPNSSPERLEALGVPSQEN